MNPKELQDQVKLSQDMILKAQQICAKLHSSVNEQLLKSDVSDGFFKDPTAALMEEDVIREAPQHFIALAAFISQSVEGLQNAFLILNAKVDALSAALQESVNCVQKANDATLSLVKAATEEIPVTHFTATPQFTREQMLKAAQQKANSAFDGYSRQQIADALFNLVQANKCQIKDITKFEQSGTISPDIKDLVIEELKKITA